MLVATKNGRKVYHTEQCPYGERIATGKKMYFYTKDEANEQGYVACKHCANMYKKYLRERERIESFARSHDMEVLYFDNEIYIRNWETNSFWKIVITGDKRKMLLYHANAAVYRTLSKRQNIPQYTYHAQKDANRKTIEGYMNYIKKHDKWRSIKECEYKKMPQRTKKERLQYRRMEKKARKKSIRNVLNLIEQLSEKEEKKAMR